MTVSGGQVKRHASTSELVRPLFRAGEVESDGHLDVVAIQRSPEFRTPRRKQRVFVFPVSVLFMVWFFVYVLLSAYPRGFMATKVLGLINVGILMGLAQFLSTLVIMASYCRYADRTLEPAVDDMRMRAGTRS